MCDGWHHERRHELCYKMRFEISRDTMLYERMGCAVRAPIEELVDTPQVFPRGTSCLAAGDIRDAIVLLSNVRQICYRALCGIPCEIISERHWEDTEMKWTTRSCEMY